MNIYLGLVHYPVLNKNQETITTSVTNMDLHDISRSCCTYNVKQYFIVTPIKSQQVLIHRIIDHWNEEEAYKYNPDRFEAFKRVKLVDTIDIAVSQIQEIEKSQPLIVVTGANFKEKTVEINQVIEKSSIDNRPIFLLFGTGWGLSALVTDRADFRLSSILGSNDEGYNHLSVRSAVAIYLDRFGRAQENC